MRRHAAQKSTPLTRGMSHLAMRAATRCPRSCVPGSAAGRRSAKRRGGCNTSATRPPRPRTRRRSGRRGPRSAAFRDPPAESPAVVARRPPRAGISARSATAARSRDRAERLFEAYRRVEQKLDADRAANAASGGSAVPRRSTSQRASFDSQSGPVDRSGTSACRLLRWPARRRGRCVAAAGVYRRGRGARGGNARGQAETAAAGAGVPSSGIRIHAPT
jgi:hypothetical protein